MNQPKSTEATHKYSFVCINCHKIFGSNRKHTATCSDSCRKAQSRARTNKLGEKRKYRFKTSAFIYYLAASCRRSGTVEVLPKTLKELEKLHSVYKFSLKANGYGEDDQFSLCHIWPIQHPHYVGSMYAENLTVSYRDLNSGHSNGFTAGAGHKISRLNLSPRWLLRKEDKIKSVVEKIVEYLEEEFTATVAVKLKLQTATRQAVLDWLASCTDQRVPSLAECEAMTTAALTKLKAEIVGKTSGYAPTSGINSNDVFLAELKRLSHHRPELEQVTEVWLETMPAILPLIFDLQWCGSSESEYKAALEPLKPLRQAQFNLLHGGNINDFLTVLNTYHTFESLALPMATNFVTLSDQVTASQVEPNSSAIFTLEDYAELQALEAEFSNVIHPELFKPTHIIIDEDLENDDPIFTLYQKPKEKPTQWRLTQ